MLKDIRSIKIQGANFKELTQLPLFCEGNNPAKAILLYGRNGSGKSTIARAFSTIKGVPNENIRTSLILDAQETEVTLTEKEKAHIYVFDEDFVNKNVRVQEDGLGSIVMLGEQAGLTEQIEATTEELKSAENDKDQKKTVLDKYNDSANLKSPTYYINKMRSALQQDNGWAGRKRQIEQLRRNASVFDNTYRDFITISPKRTRDELIVDFDHEWERLEVAQSGVSKIIADVPTVPSIFTLYATDTGNSLLKQSIEHPELTKREQYLLNLVQSGHGEELKNTAQEFELSELTICPKCHQPLSNQYKSELIESIHRVLSEEVKNHQTNLRALILSELVLDLEPFQNLPSYQTCIKKINDINILVKSNNVLLQSKIDDPYTPITDELSSINDKILYLEESLKQLENERTTHNRSVEDTSPIKLTLNKINNEIAYWDVINFSIQHDAMQIEKENAERDFNEALRTCERIQECLNSLNAQRDSIYIAIDVINDGLKYIFFSNNRMHICVDGRSYKLVCNGRPVKPKDVSVGERNIIGLCYFFTNILAQKSRDNAFAEEYLLVIDDPVSSYDLENRVGILSYLKFELGKFLLGNPDSRALIMTHDLFTAIDVGKILLELKSDCKKKYNGQSIFTFSQKELRDQKLEIFSHEHNEYNTLMNMIYKYANGENDELNPYIGNIIRQVLEAFSTFEFRKSIDKVSVDEEVLSVIEQKEHRVYFRNLMYRLILNGGSHRCDQTRNMQVDFFSFISEPDKRRTAKDVLCFMELLNAHHIRAHLGVTAANVIDSWCKKIGITEK